MDEHWDQTIAAMKQDIDRRAAELNEDRRALNRICGRAGRQPIYPDADTTTQAASTSIRRDQWYGQPISAAVREYLSMRRALNQGPATVAEIHEALVNGGYAFETKEPENAKRALRISLTKNSGIFHRLPDGKHYGLLDWYPEAKAKKAREPEVADDEAQETTVADETVADAKVTEEEEKLVAKPTRRPLFD